MMDFRLKIGKSGSEATTFQNRWRLFILRNSDTDMSKDIHHSCKCTGQNFTFEEWCKYLEQENRPEIVHQYKDFGFNIFDVCLTPDVKIDWANKTCSFEVVTAQSDNGRWDFGLHYNFWTQGGCNGAAYIDTLKGGYNTEKEAINVALDSLGENCQRVIDEIQFRGGDIDDDDDSNEPEIRGSSALPNLKNAMLKIAHYKGVFNPRQLELFDL